MKISGLFILILVAVAAMASDVPPLPQEVQDYIQDRAGCNHLAGEDYSDPSHGQAMAKVLRECGYGDLNGVPVSTYSVTTIDMVEKRLRKKYKKHPDILRAMDEAKDQQL